MMVAPLALALLLVQTAPAMAQTDRCASAHASLPAALAGWNETAPAGTLGKAFTVAAADPAAIRGLSAGETTRAGNAALVPFEVDRDATYHVALSDRAWVDVAAGNAVIKSVAHMHGPACSGITKVVDFPLKRGRYALHITGITAPTIRVLIARA